jgi:hypothetical protein
MSFRQEIGVELIACFLHPESVRLFNAVGLSLFPSLHCGLCELVDEYPDTAEGEDEQQQEVTEQ